MLKQEFNKAEELAMQLKAYVNTEIELVKLTLAEKLSKLLSNFIALIFLGVVFFLFILFTSLSLAYLIGEWTGKIWIGFLMVAVIYFLMGIITWLTREKLLQVPIMNAIIRQLFSKDQQEKYTK